MSPQNSNEETDAATEAAQGVVDRVSSWQYSADKEVIESELDEGLDEAGVEMSEDEKKSVVEEIDDLKQDEDAGTPEVDEAQPKE